MPRQALGFERRHAGKPVDACIDQVAQRLGRKVGSDRAVFLPSLGQGRETIADLAVTPADDLSEETVVLGVRYATQEDDKDADGIPDSVDECPLLPEDMDGFEDGDGCEDPDNDNDMVPDADDLCPNEEALEDQDDDEDGCTDA